MGLTKRHLLDDAERMFVKEDKTYKEISDALGVALSTVGKWAKRYDWQQLREDYRMSSVRIAAKLRRMLAEDVDKLTALDTAATDRILKAVKSIRELDKHVDMLSNTIEVIDELNNFMKLRNEEKALGVLQRIVPDFLVYMREKFK